ncbi:MAG: hypothetical protein RL338_1056 [Chloroflexota bacterium]|jgi:hypothetical protein
MAPPTFEELEPLDRPVRDEGYEVAPATVGRGGGRRIPIVAGVAAVLVVLAVAKPWGDGTTGPDGRLADASSPAAPSPSVDPLVEAPGISVPRPAPPETITILRINGPIAAALTPVSDRWGLATGGWIRGETSPWTEWTDEVALFEGPDDGRRPGPVCLEGGGLPSGRFLAVTAPSGLAAASAIEVLPYDADGVPGDPPSLYRISRPVDEGVAYLFRADGRPWSPGAYRLVVPTPVGPVTLDGCIAAATPGAGLPELGVVPLPDAIGPDGMGRDGLAAITDWLDAQAGRWGIGTGGWRSGTNPWTAWAPVAPRRIPVDGGRLARPDCGDIDATPSGLIVAITTGPEASGSVVGYRFGSQGPPVRVEDLVLLGDGSTPGIVHLARTDGTNWPSGAYRFVVPVEGGEVALDACLISFGSPSGPGATSGILAP